MILGLGDHAVSIVRRINGRDLPLAVCGIQSIFHLAGGNAERCSFVPVDLHVDLRIRDLQIAGHVLQKRSELRVRAQFGFKLGSVLIELVGVGVLQRELILALG